MKNNNTIIKESLASQKGMGMTKNPYHTLPTAFTLRTPKPTANLGETQPNI